MSTTVPQGPPLPSGYGAKRKRVSRACDRCNKLGRKCLPSTDKMCQSCIDYGDNCTYDRPMGKRGAPPKAQRVKKNEPQPPSPPSSLPPGLNHEQIMHLIDVFYTAVYPIYHYFSWPHFLADVAGRRYEYNPAFQSTVLAVCAIAGARIRDRAYLHTSLHDPETPVDHEGLRDAAIAAVSKRDRPFEFDDLRSANLMHVLGVQNGDYELVKLMFGRYHGIAACFKFNDERFWPQDLEDWQREERRALFWSTYTSDVFLSSLWGGMILHSRAHLHVQYPSWRLDEQNSHSETHWIVGWNAVSDLYRILERILETDARRKGEQLPGPPELPLEFRDRELAIDTAWPAVRQLFDAVPRELKECAPLTGDVSRDIYSFTAANLNVTLQAVRMAIACSNPMSMAERCHVAGELLDTLARIPTVYMQGISAPFVHQLGMIGSLLGEVVQGPLTVSAYIHVRQILLTFGNILSSLESSLKCTGSSVSERLFHHVARIDAFMQNEATGLGQEMLRDAIDAQRNSAAHMQDDSEPLVQPLPAQAPFAPSEAVPPAPGTDAIDPGLQDAQEMFTIPNALLQDWLFAQDQQLFDSLFRPHPH